MNYQDLPNNRNSAHGNETVGTQTRAIPFEQLIEQLADASSIRELLTVDVENAYMREPNLRQRALMESDLREIAKRGKFTKDFENTFSNFKRMLKNQEKALRAERKAAHAMENKIVFDFLENPSPDLCSYTYCINDDGVFLDGEQICTQPVMLSGSFRDIETGETSFCITFEDRGRWRTLTEKREALFSPARIIHLAAYGLSVHGENARRFIRFLDTFEAENKEALAPKLSFSRLGWFDKNQFAPYEPDMVFSGMENQDFYGPIKESGSIGEWIDYARGLRENIPLRLAMAASFASPLIKKAGISPFVLHLWGLSGTGKTVTLMVAASVWGDPGNGGLVGAVNATQNSITNRAAFYCSVPVFLDELQTISHMDWSGIETFVMAITEGIERGRMRYDEARQARRWNCCFLITGEEPIVKENSKAGFFNRVIEINCDEPLMADGNATAGFVRTNYGHAGKAYVNYIKSRAAEIPALFRQQKAEIIQQIRTTDKQATAMAAMMVADRLAGECLFPGECPLTVTDVQPYLKIIKEVDNSERAYEYICGVIAANHAHFSEDASPNIELWGKIDGTECLFNKVKLVECLKAGGFDFDAVKKGWYKAGRLRKNSQNRFIHDASYFGVKASSVKLVLQGDGDYYTGSDDELPL